MPPSVDLGFSSYRGLNQSQLGTQLFEGHQFDLAYPLSGPLHQTASASQEKMTDVT
jgi:hypothetical protein